MSVVQGRSAARSQSAAVAAMPPRSDTDAFSPSGLIIAHNSAAGHYHDVSGVAGAGPAKIWNVAAMSSSR
jgi:hypothetical protein